MEMLSTNKDAFLRREMPGRVPATMSSFPDPSAPTHQVTDDLLIKKKVPMTSYRFAIQLHYLIVW